jgi:tetratricopeptide (TPR) repeat protein
LTASVPPPPDQIGPYRVLRSIARGGMAEVYEVEEKFSGERYALKLLDLAGSALPRFNREYEALARLNHPNIVRVYQYGFFNQQPWITMELLAGVPLQARVKAAGRPGEASRTAEVVRVSGFVADALQYIHRRGLVHRDLKSDNVVVLPDGRVKLLDFGTAHLYDALEPITKEGEFVGTFAYAAPEQITGGPVDWRADLYALGVLMYRLCTGQRPFEANDPATLAKLHAKVMPKAPREITPELPKELDALIMQLLAKRPEQRPQQAEVVVDALRLLGPSHSGKLDVYSSLDRAVGREAEVRQVADRMAAAAPGGAVLVEGGDGSGRSRFARAVASALEERGWSVADVTLAEDGALEALVAALDKAAELVKTKPEVRTAMGVLRKAASAMAEGPRRREALRKAGGLVLSERVKYENKPLVFLVQELHLAGPVALDLLVGLRREVAQASLPIRFLASSSDNESEAVTMVRQRLPDADRQSLPALNARGVALTVASILNRRQPPSDLARRILHASGGQPVYVEEVVRQLVRDHSLAARGLDGNRLEWTTRDTGPIALAPSARATVDRALRSLPRVERRVLEALAVAGEEATIAHLAGSLALDVDAVSPTIDALVDQGWLRFVDDEETRLAWNRTIARPIVEEQLHPCRRALLRRTVLETFEGPATPGKIRLLLHANRVEQAALEVVACGEKLLLDGNPTAAVDLLDEVVKRLATTKPEEPEKFVDAWLQLVRSLMLVRATDPTLVKALMRAQELARTDEVKVQVVLMRARLQSVIGHYPNYRKFLGEAWDLAQRLQQPRTSSTVATLLAQAWQWAGQPRTAGEWFDKARAAASQSDNAVVVAYTDATYASWQLSKGDLKEAEATAKGAMDTFQARGHLRGYWSAIPAWAHALREQGRISDALAVLAKDLPDVREAESPSHYVGMLVASARAEVDLQRLGKAQEALDELESTVRPGEHLHMRLEARLLRGRILLASGQYRDALGVLNETHTRAKAAELIALAELSRALMGEVLWSLRDEDAARAHFRNAQIGLLGTGDMLALAEACVSWARTVADKDDIEPALQPANAFLDSQPAVLLRLERVIARARRLDAKGERIPAFHLWREAANALNALAASLDDIERAALRVHSWSRLIRRGLKG